MKLIHTSTLARRTPRHAPGRLALIAITALLAVLPSCRSPLGVDDVGPAAVRAELEASVLTGDEPTDATRQTLSSLGLQSTWEDDPDAALEQLRALGMSEHNRSIWCALAELHFVRARETDDRRHDIATVICAWWYLTSTHLGPPPDPFDRRFRLACDLYNRSLVNALISEDDSVRFQPGTFPIPGGSITVTMDRSQFPWDKSLITRFIAADRLAVRGFDVRNRDFGLGAPLIGLGDNKEATTPERKYLPPRLCVPATAFVRVDDAPEAWADGTLTARLELYAGDDVPSVEVDGRKIPLETDITAPLAYQLESARVWDLELSGFMGEVLNAPTGMFMLRPYVPGKIPVVLVHGTASSPARWAPMFNGLLADPIVRSRCQFWFFTYSTGNPIAYSGALLREALNDVVDTIDPDGRDEALHQMVVIGHSQGGLLTRMAASSSGDAIWQGLTDVPFDQFELEPGTRELLLRTMWWERVPDVSRVVFIATPHQGSYLTLGWIGSFARSLVTLPKTLGTEVSDLVTRNRDRFPPELRDKIPTAVDNMTPENPFLLALGGLPIDPSVKRNSIIAVEEEGPLDGCDDGVVKYTSAHLDDVESEFVVHSGHSCQENPLVIREVRRILLEQVAAWDEARGAPVDNKEGSLP